MRKRNIRLMIRLNEKENILLIDKVRKSGLSKEAYIRYLISGYILEKSEVKTKAFILNVK